jgi:DNA polymerase
MFWYLDFETFSDRDIVKDGAYVYTASERFVPLIMSYALDDAPVQRVEMVAEMCEVILEALQSGGRIVAHNAQFERLVCSRLAGMPEGEYLSPERFIDTAALAAVQGYPRALGPLAKALGVTMKDSAGTRLISLFCKPKRDGTRTLPADKPEEWTRFGEYCDTDVYALRDAHRALMARYLHTRADLAGWPTEIEQRVFIADQQINDRGIRVDTEMAREAVRAGADNALELEAEMYALTGLANPGSVAQMTGWLAERGIEVPDLRAATVSELLAREDLGDVVRRALVIRQETALAASKKFAAAVRSTSGDGRARGLFQYCGAHTGRWAGRRIQASGTFLFPQLRL